MSDVRDLIRAIAFDRAYQLAATEGMGGSCVVCGLPAVRTVGFTPHCPVALCGRCEHPRPRESERYEHDLRCRKGVERLMRIAEGES